MTDLPTELAAEIARVTEFLHLMRSDSFIISVRLTGAKLALASGDTAAMETALKDLKGYGNDH